MQIDNRMKRLYGLVLEWSVRLLRWADGILATLIVMSKERDENILPILPRFPFHPIDPRDSALFCWLAIALFSGSYLPLIAQTSAIFLKFLEAWWDRNRCTLHKVHVGKKFSCCVSKTFDFCFHTFRPYGIKWHQLEKNPTSPFWDMATLTCLFWEPWNINCRF